MAKTPKRRACVIVLDAVGAGELPDAADYGDEGSNTLANVATAVGGLDLPNLEALGLGNIEPLDGCPPQPGAPAIAGRLLERSKGKDTTTGHWEMMGVVTAQPFPLYPHGFPHDVIDPFMHRTGRGVLGNKPASGTEIINELGDEHQKTGKWIVYTSGDSVFHGKARGRPRHRAAVHRRAGELRQGRRRPSRLLARAEAAELPDPDPRSRRHRARCRQDPGHLRRLRHRRVASDQVEHRRHPADREAAAGAGRGLRLHEPRRDGLVVGSPKRSRQLPSLPPGLRPPPAGSARGTAAW
jgi:phosphopentomutase